MFDIRGNFDIGFVIHRKTVWCLFSSGQAKLTETERGHERYQHAQLPGRPPGDLLKAKQIRYRTVPQPHYRQSQYQRDEKDQRDRSQDRDHNGGDASDVVAFGPLFDASDIRPQEEIKARRLLFVPRDKAYDLLRVKVVIPSYFKSSVLADDDLIRVVGGISMAKFVLPQALGNAAAT